MFFNNLWPGLLCTALGQCLMSKRDHSDVTPDPDDPRTWDDLISRVVRLRVDCLEACEQIGLQPPVLYPLPFNPPATPQEGSAAIHPQPSSDLLGQSAGVTAAYAFAFSALPLVAAAKAAAAIRPEAAVSVPNTPAAATCPDDKPVPPGCLPFTTAAQPTVLGQEEIVTGEAATAVGQQEIKK